MMRSPSKLDTKLQHKLSNIFIPHNCCSAERFGKVCKAPKTCHNKMKQVKNVLEKN